ncbi:MAG: tryptophan-rich sensory protein [Flavobacteriales bacterium]|nr:tryptophan-rich sensory protein [Flavobacteriales bacterium]
MRPPSPALKYIICIIGTLAVGSLSGLATAGSIDTWYASIQKPSFNPPNWIFGPVWTLLYVLMGVAAAMVWNSRHDPTDLRRALVLYLIQLGLNATWSLVFFGLRSPVGALVNIVMLLIAIVLCIGAFKKMNARSGLLLYPYLAWVSFATVLNASIVILN